MNIINVNDVERELRKVAANAVYPQAQQWVLSVGRNYVLGKISEKDADMNFRVYEPAKIQPDLYGEPPPFSRLPTWAKEAVQRGEELHWFDPVQVQRRPLWQALETIVTWYNVWPATDTRLRRLDRVSFDTALAAAAMWFQDVQQNIWEYVKDKPPVIRTYEHGYFWVRLVTMLHFEREGRLMKHCVGNGSYFDRWRNAKSEYYSLRDKHNRPHCTIEVTTDMRRHGAVLQCKGNSNHKPPPIYQPYIRRFFNDMGWSIVGDQHYID